MIFFVLIIVRLDRAGKIRNFKSNLTLYSMCNQSGIDPVIVSVSLNLQQMISLDEKKGFNRALNL